MEQYSIEQRAQIVELYFSNQRSIVLTQRAYRRYFNVRVGPSESTLNRLVANFRQQGAVRNLPGAGRRRTVHADDNIELVFENKHGVAVSVKGVRYRTMLENVLRPAVENHPQV